jgi:hypothetical protein
MCTPQGYGDDMVLDAQGLQRVFYAEPDVV